MSKQRPCDKRNSRKIFDELRKGIYAMVVEEFGDCKNMIQLSEMANKIARNIMKTEKLNISRKRAS